MTVTKFALLLSPLFLSLGLGYFLSHNFSKEDFAPLADVLFIGNRFAELILLPTNDVFYFFSSMACFAVFLIPAVILFKYAAGLPNSAYKDHLVDGKISSRTIWGAAFLIFLFFSGNFTTPIIGSNGDFKKNAGLILLPLGPFMNYIMSILVWISIYSMLEKFFEWNYNDDGNS